MNLEDSLLTVRKVISPLPGIAKPTFYGFLMGMLMLFIVTLFRPFIEPATKGVMDIFSIPDWLWVAAGTAVVIAFRALQGRPLLNDRTQEFVDLIRLLMREGMFTDTEKRQLCRTLTHKIVGEFSLRRDLGIQVKNAQDAAISEMETGAQQVGSEKPQES